MNITFIILIIYAITLMGCLISMYIDDGNYSESKIAVFGISAITTYISFAILIFEESCKL